MNGCELNRLICHCCKTQTFPHFLVPCKTSGCGFFFCHRCLTSRYKYSKAKVVKLPTAHWKCPVCAERCQCDECISAGISIPIKKKVVKRRDLTGHFRRKKRIRKPIFNVQTNLETKTPYSERETNPFFSPLPQRSVFPISSINFAIIVDFFGSETYVQPGEVREVFPASTYEAMSVDELIKIAMRPLINL